MFYSSAKTVKKHIISLLFLLASYQGALSAETAYFIDSGLYFSQFQMHGQNDLDKLNIMSGSLGVTIFRSNNRWGALVRATYIFPQSEKIRPSVGPDSSEKIEWVFKSGFDMLAGPGVILSAGPMNFLLGGGAHFVMILKQSDNVFSAGLGITSLVFINLSPRFHFNMGTDFAFDFMGDIVYGSFSHHFFRSFTFGLSTGFGFTF